MKSKKILSIVMAAIVALAALTPFIAPDTFSITADAAASAAPAAKKKTSAKKKASAKKKKSSAAKKKKSSSAKKKKSKKSSAKRKKSSKKRSGKKTSSISHAQYTPPVETPQNDSLTLFVNSELIGWLP